MGVKMRIREVRWLSVGYIRPPDSWVRGMTMIEIMVVLGLMVCVVAMIGILLPARSESRVVGDAVVRWWVTEASLASSLALSSGRPVRLAVWTDSSRRELQWKQVRHFQREGDAWVSIRDAGKVPGEWFVVPPRGDPSHPGSQWSVSGEGTLFSGCESMEASAGEASASWCFIEYGADGGLASTALLCLSTRSDLADGSWLWGDPIHVRSIRILRNGTCIYPD